MQPHSLHSTLPLQDVGQPLAGLLHYEAKAQLVAVTVTGQLLLLGRQGPGVEWLVVSRMQLASTCSNAAGDNACGLKVGLGWFESGRGVSSSRGIGQHGLASQLRHHEQVPYLH